MNTEINGIHLVNGFTSGSVADQESEKGKEAANKANGKPGGRYRGRNGRYYNNRKGWQGKNDGKNSGKGGKSAEVVSNGTV